MMHISIQENAQENSEISSKQKVVIAARDECESIENVIREKESCVGVRDDDVRHDAYQHSGKCTLSFNILTSNSSAASLSKASLIYMDPLQQREKYQADEKKKEKSERMFRSFHFELSPTMGSEQSSRAALISTMVLDMFKNFILSLWFMFMENLWLIFWKYLDFIE